MAEPNSEAGGKERMASAQTYCTMCRAKLHGATVTDTELQYEGSITIDLDLIDAAGLYPYEQVQVLNQNTGGRFETYILPGERGKRRICLNGPAARLAEVGDIVLVVAYGLVPASEAAGWRPTVVIVGPENEVQKVIRPDGTGRAA